MHYLITGHTGFKGAWLSLLLKQQGHQVSGISLDPEPGALFEVAGLDGDLEHDIRLDIRDAAATAKAVQQVSPDVVFHLAAQPLVRESYLEPRLTFETNVMGTLNVIEAVANTDSVKAHVVITTDKVYKNVNRVEGYKEYEPLGGDDPYSSSKAMADIMTQSWIKSFPGIPTAIARAGNVIGGGDVSKDRLLVDLLQSFSTGIPTSIRYPDAVRPWQHVLDCVNGYVALADELLAGGGLGEWNFGPAPESFVSVRSIADAASKLWGDEASWIDESSGTHLHEAGLLALDSSKSEAQLHWRNKLKFEDSLAWTIAWKKKLLLGENARDVTVRQINDFISIP
jgi:CDP-glucose 4,6-dehydratase